MISAHILLVHGHIMPLTTRLLALSGEVPVSPLLREILRDIVAHFGGEVPELDEQDRMSVYEGRNKLYLAALAQPHALYQIIGSALRRHFKAHGVKPEQALAILQLDQALCPREGQEITLHQDFDYDASAVEQQLAAMELPAITTRPGDSRYTLEIRHPGGVGDILHDADGGSWLRGVIADMVIATENEPPALSYIAIA